MRFYKIHRVIENERLKASLKGKKGASPLETLPPEILGELSSYLPAETKDLLSKLSKTMNAKMKAADRKIQEPTPSNLVNAFRWYLGSLLKEGVKNFSLFPNYPVDPYILPIHLFAFLFAAVSAIVTGAFCGGAVCVLGLAPIAEIVAIATGIIGLLLGFIVGLGLGFIASGLVGVGICAVAGTADLLDTIGAKSLSFYYKHIKPLQEKFIHNHSNKRSSGMDKEPPEDKARNFVNIELKKPSCRTSYRSPVNAAYLDHHRISSTGIDVNSKEFNQVRLSS